MRFSFPIRCLVAAIVLAPVFWVFAIQKDGDKKDPPTVKTTAGAFSICPLSPNFFHGGYMTYYARQCGSDECYRTWDDAPNLKLANGAVLCGSTTNCIDFQ